MKAPHFEKFGFLCVETCSCEALSLSLSLSLLDFKIVKIIPLLISTTQQLKTFQLQPQHPRTGRRRKMIHKLC
jgi:hypothetical protein